MVGRVAHAKSSDAACPPPKFETCIWGKVGSTPLVSYVGTRTVGIRRVKKSFRSQLYNLMLHVSPLSGKLSRILVSDIPLSDDLVSFVKYFHGRLRDISNT